MYKNSSYFDTFVVGQSFSSSVETLWNGGGRETKAERRKKSSEQARAILKDGSKSELWVWGDPIWWEVRAVNILDNPYSSSLYLRHPIIQLCCLLPTAHIQSFVINIPIYFHPHSVQFYIRDFHQQRNRVDDSWSAGVWRCCRVGW